MYFYIVLLTLQLLIPEKKTQMQNSQSFFKAREPDLALVCFYFPKMFVVFTHVHLRPLAGHSQWVPRPSAPIRSFIYWDWAGIMDVFLACL